MIAPMAAKERLEIARAEREGLRQKLRAEAFATCKTFMTDRGERMRTYRDFGITTELKRHIDDHDGIADALRGFIHGVELSRRSLMPWNLRAGERLMWDRWRLVGMRLAELRLARTVRRRAKLRIVQTVGGLS